MLACCDVLLYSGKMGNVARLIVDRKHVEKCPEQLSVLAVITELRFTLHAVTDRVGNNLPTRLIAIVILKKSTIVPHNFIRSISSDLFKGRVHVDDWIIDILRISNDDG